MQDGVPVHMLKVVKNCLKTITYQCYSGNIDASTHSPPLCPLCRIHEHTTQHLYSCPQIHTTLLALDLWRDPLGVTTLLDDWWEKQAAKPHEKAETDSGPTIREEWVDRTQQGSGSTTFKHSIIEGSPEELVDPDGCRIFSEIGRIYA